MATIGSLIVTVAADAEPFRRGLKQAKTEHQLFTEHVLKNKKFKEEMGPDSSFMSGNGPAAAIALAAVAVRKLVQTLQEAAASFEETSNRAEQFGLTFNEMRGLEILGDSLSGELFSGLNRFQKLLLEAKQGSDEAQRSFQRLGLDYENLASMPISEAFFEAFAGADGHAEQAAIAYELMGKNAAALIPILNKGKEGVADAKKMAEALSLSEVDQVRLSRLDQTFDDFGNTMKAAKEHAAAFVAGGWQQMAADAFNAKLATRLREEAEAAAKAAREQKKLKMEHIEAAAKAAELAEATAKAVREMEKEAELAGLQGPEKKLRELELQGLGGEDFAKANAAANAAADAQQRAKAADDFRKLDAELQEHIDLMGKAGNEAKIWKLAMEGIPLQQIERLQDKLQRVADIDLAKQINAQWIDPLVDFGHVMEDLQRLFNNEQIGLEQFAAAADAAFAKLPDLGKLSTNLPQALTAGSAEAISFQNRADRAAASAASAERDPAKKLEDLRKALEKKAEDQIKKLEEIRKAIRDQNPVGEQNI